MNEEHLEEIRQTSRQICNIVGVPTLYDVPERLLQQRETMQMVVSYLQDIAKSPCTAKYVSDCASCLADELLRWVNKREDIYKVDL